MGKIIVSQEVIEYFEALIHLLYEKEYFGFVESAIQYVDKIIDFIYSEISTFPKINSPEELRKFGDYYIFYSINQTTTWYIFFQIDEIEQIYLITAIFNNHKPEIQHLNL